MDFWLEGPTFGPDLRRIEDALSQNPDAALNELFADWPMLLYAQLYVADLAPFPHLKARLPRMPAEAVQRGFNSTAGTLALQQAVSFVQSMAAAYRTYLRKDFRQATALDYGVGWGRIFRIMLHQLPESRLIGCDAWASTIKIAKSLGFRSEIVTVPAHPDTLPFAPGQFDLVWLSSLFTHFTADAGKKILKALHPIVARDGMLTMTIWTPDGFPKTHPLRQQGERYAWLPTEGVDPKMGYGNAMLTLDYARREWTDWELLGTDIIANDPKQFMLFFRPR